MKTKKIVIGIFLFFVVVLPYEAISQQNGTITIIYNNVSSGNRLEADWGFSAWIETGEGITLFDTGSKSAVLQKNFEKLELNPAAVARIVVSHEHYDHTGGLRHILDQVNDNTPVFLPNDYDSSLKQDFTDLNFIMPGKFREIAKNIWVTKVFVNPQNRIHEQALVLVNENSFIVVTGCAHPGIVEICESVCAFFPGKKPELVTGGFHLVQATPGFVKQISTRLKKLGFEHVAPSHCTGEKAIALFQEDWGEQFVNLNLGDSYRF